MAAPKPGKYKGPLYHGTTHDIQGKDIVPHAAGVHDNSLWADAGHSGQKSSDHAFATENENVAWRFAHGAGVSSRWQAERSRREGVDAPEPDRVRVHTVAPHPAMTKGVYHRDHTNFGRSGAGNDDLAEWRAPAFRVKGQIDIAPGHQGTFPELNWHQFRSKEATVGEDMNHPRDDAIRLGHEPMGSSAKFKDRFARGSWEHDQDHAKESGESPVAVPTASHDQMDLFSGRTVQDHAENDESTLGDYHRNALFGRL
jgi:hypothetical protein